MNIAIYNVYAKQYDNDRLFDVSSCVLGHNLLLPAVVLKKDLEEKNHQCHTVDLFLMKDIDKIVFMDLPMDSIMTVHSVRSLLAYIYHRSWKTDYLLKSLLSMNKKDRMLVLAEPPVVRPKQYEKKYHRWFDKVLTWNDAMVDNKIYFKLSIPQPITDEIDEIPFSEKKNLVMMCGNKSSREEGELYSERKKIISYFENNEKQFDLYGFGWEKENIKNYKGSVSNKLDVISKYKYALCFENMCNIKGYITEKIFDCFFAKCVPIYWGASNIDEYVPANTFIDMRKFQSIESMYEFIENITESQYQMYLENINSYLHSDLFKDNFSVEAYVDAMEHHILS